MSDHDEIAADSLALVPRRVYSAVTGYRPSEVPRTMTVINHSTGAPSAAPPVGMYPSYPIWNIICFLVFGWILLGICTLGIASNVFIVGETMGKAMQTVITVFLAWILTWILTWVTWPFTFIRTWGKMAFTTIITWGATLQRQKMSYANPLDWLFTANRFVMKLSLVSVIRVVVTDIRDVTYQPITLLPIVVTGTVVVAYAVCQLDCMLMDVVIAHYMAGYIRFQARPQEIRFVTYIICLVAGTIADTAYLTITSPFNAATKLCELVWLVEGGWLWSEVMFNGTSVVTRLTLLLSICLTLAFGDKDLAHGVALLVSIVGSMGSLWYYYDGAPVNDRRQVRRIIRSAHGVLHRGMSTEDFDLFQDVEEIPSAGPGAVAAGAGATGTSVAEAGAAVADEPIAARTRRHNTWRAHPADESTRTWRAA